RIVDPDDGHTVAKRQLLDLDDLLGGDLAQRPAEDRGVIRGDRDRASVDLAEPGDDPIPGDPAIFHTESVGAMRREDVELDERARVEQHLDAISGGRLARGAPLVGRLGLRVQGLVAPLPVLVDLLLGDGRGFALRRLDALEAGRGAAHRRERARFALGHGAYIVGAVPHTNSQPGAQLDLDRAITLRQLRTFKTVADLSSFSLAANRLKLSQPSVSYQVKE